MSRAAWIVAATVACAASVAAASSDDDYRSITVTGCIQNFSSTDASGVTEHGFLLSNPTLVQRPGKGVPTPARDTSATGMPTGTSGTAAAGMPTSGTWASTAGSIPPKAKSSYRLEGDDETLKPQVGHKVEITGAIVSKKDGAAKSDPDRLQVVTIKMLESNCSK